MTNATSTKTAKTMYVVTFIHRGRDRRVRVAAKSGAWAIRKVARRFDVTSTETMSAINSLRVPRAAKIEAI